MSIINLELRIATCFSCFLPSSLREQRSCTGILGIAAHRMLVSLPLCRLLVSFAGTKHCCLTAVNRDGALCCPDFPRDRGLKPYAFLPLSRDRPMCYFCFMFASLTLCRLRRGCVASRGCVRSAHVVSASPRLCRFAHVVSASPRLCGFAGFTARSAITARLRAITHACVLYFANGDITAAEQPSPPAGTSPRS